ncbi:MAG: DUF86 domain-containing protein [Propionibacteriaceae bacterium]|nr:DUF86 domain-containing protein [Propionibacteriaceae bacterium]
MNRKTAKEFIHIRDWLDRAAQIVTTGRDVYDADALLQEAGDSLLMKIGEAASRLSRANVQAPEPVKWTDAIASRNWLIHQYDLIDREITWATLTSDLPVWTFALGPLFQQAACVLESAHESQDMS